MNLIFLDTDNPSEASQRLREYLKERLTNVGHDVIGLWSLPMPRRSLSSTSPRREFWFHVYEDLSTTLNQANCSEIDDVDAVIVVADGAISAAHATTMGYAFAKSIPIFLHLPEFRDPQREEDPFDLQTAFLCEQSGGRVVATIDELLAAIKILDGTLAMRAVVLA